MRVSVVICTYNRAESLAATILSLQRQRHRDLEVVVVNGPSTDGTEEVLSRFSTIVKVRSCPAANLSMSRNIGIRAASGEIVAFIDDDALPEFHWLDEALPAFDDPEVAGVGGIVFDHTGMGLQYRFSAADRFGNASTSADTPFDELAFPGSFTFPYLQGTNALFRRHVLEEVGGFDEVYDYYLDETDLCCRIVDAGYRLRQIDGAPVHHKFLPSGIRDAQRIVTNWFPIAKNHVYFGYRHGLDAASELQVIDASRGFVQTRLDDAEFHEQAGRLPTGSAERAAAAMGDALATGIELGRSRRDERLPRLDGPSSSFQPFPVEERRPGALSIVLVSNEYPPRLVGGIGRFVGEVAPALARRGHDVRVITRATPDDPIGTVDLEDGVWVHRIACPTLGAAGIAPQTLDHINAFVTASAAELARVSAFTRVDVVYAPAWDVDALGALRTSPLPTVVMLATPVATSARTPAHREALGPLIELEREVFSHAERIHAISAAIVGTITTEYGSVFDPSRIEVAPIGLVDRVGTVVEPPGAGEHLRVFFVGRFEPRKGIDLLLQTIERLAPAHPHVEWCIAGVDVDARPGATSPTERWRADHRDADWIDRVRFLGAVDDDELHRSYDAADLVVLPSRFESFGLVMTEAMMHGRALVSSAVGGIEEVVRADVDGILVPPGDADELAGAVAALLGDATTRARLARAGRERFTSALTIDRSAERLESLLGDATPRRPGGDGFEVDDAVIGRSNIELGPRSVVRLDPRGRRWTLKVVALEPSLIAITGAGQRVVEVVPHQPVSIRVEPTGETVIEIVTGRLVTAGPTNDPSIRG